eukprot:TRINITY_DN2948_c0_g1_i2.p1 TRINITY_DN2948_c0_g1~~TRINITY_DN2948_c0_g1_i2.p1  ORF type:complete len:710 (-),score=159.82 TRINITY_DN2948_c0_g1_i2:38-2167(-)
MKGFALVSAVLASVTFQAGAVQHVKAEAHRESPVAQVVALLSELKTRIDADEKTEQQSYDKYACWCEAALERKASDISRAKEQLGSLEALLAKLKGEIASHAADVDNINKAITANVASQREATEVREQETDEYNSEKIELEQSIGALSAAMQVLSGAGSGKKGMLENLQEAQVLGVVAGLHGVLRHAAASRVASVADLAVVKRFVERPADFVGGERATVSAVQVVQNPFGDYAPQSTQIQGILRGMHEAFTAELKKNSAEEAEQQRAFEALLRTKRAEQDTLQASLERHELDRAEKTKEAAESRVLFDDTEAQLAADEAFFEETKAACKGKASDWSTRTRLRTEEMQGIGQAIQILSSSSSVETFNNASGTLAFFQFDALAKRGDSRLTALRKVQALTVTYGSASLRKVAGQIRAGGHFDKVIASIDTMIERLRREEQDDIEHRDRCQLQQNKNTNDLSDLSHGISRSQSALEDMGKKKTSLETQINGFEVAISETSASLKELLRLRNEEHSEFIRALRDDTDAIGLLERAITALTKFYSKNDIPLRLVQRVSPEYSFDKDKAPETSWTKADYGGRSSESSGIVAILEMLKEDFQKEVKTSRAHDSAAEKGYEEQRLALAATKKTQDTTLLATRAELADLTRSMSGTDEAKSQLEADKSDEGKMQAALNQDCAWVSTHFTSRREKRKREMEGLSDAKGYLAGVEDGTEV